MGECINQQVDWGITPTEPWLVWIYETFWGFILGSLIPFNRPLIGWGLRCAGWSAGFAKLELGIDDKSGLE